MRIEPLFVGRPARNLVAVITDWAIRASGVSDMADISFC